MSRDEIWHDTARLLREATVSAFMDGRIDDFVRLTASMKTHMAQSHGLPLHRPRPRWSPERVRSIRDFWAALHTPENVAFADMVREARMAVLAARHWRDGGARCPCLNGRGSPRYPRAARLEAARQCTRECMLREEIKRRMAAEGAAS